VTIRERAWWKLRMIDNDEIKYFRHALTLVELAQISSCSVERFFLQLKLDRGARGDKMLRYG